MYAQCRTSGVGYDRICKADTGRGFHYSGKITVADRAEVKHWHGVKADSWFSHLAVECPGENTSTEWLEGVTDEVYQNLESE